MSSKLVLLQKLLIDRDEVVILHQGKAHCGCGEGFDEFSDIENHLVQSHDKLSNSASSCRRSLGDILKCVVNQLSAELPPPCLTEQQLEILGLPEKSYAVCLDEDAINGGEIQGLDCHECSASCWSFKTLKDHYMRQHPGTWSCADTCSQVSRVLFSKPLKEHRLPKGWSYHYYCPLPGCKYHLSQHKNYCESPRSFPSYSLLKQHYSKMHAHRSKICEKCGAAFSTDVYLRRHKKLVCGRLWACQSCKSVFSALENLQTHCRRKGHRLSLEILSKKQQKPEESLTKNFKGSSKYVKIAPMPSLTMTAALALSELSTKEPLASSKNQHQPLIVSTKAMAMEGRDKLLWSAASTQTSPRGDQAMAPEIPDESILTSRPSGTGRGDGGVTPKLGEIEQFSTETQTDDLELLLKPTAVATEATSAGNEDAFNTIEAQTQFDLDDILCSNYTQTVLFDTSLDQSTTMNSAETQTMLMSYDLVNMETQTMSMLFDDEAETEVNS